MAPQTMLQFLQSPRTIVDCDTMDVEIPKRLGKFVDCTSNQAIAYFELEKSTNKNIIRDAIDWSKKLTSKYPDVTWPALAGEIAMVMLQSEISKHVTGFVHVQSNPYKSYDTEGTVANARRIFELFTTLDAKFDTSRVCIKIPSTWEGLQACKILQKSGITTLATTLFTFEQVILAGEVGCHYIAPYVNELKVHFDPEFIDNNKAQVLCIRAQRYYEAQKLKTQVLAASLTSIEEIMELVGVHHITIAHKLLKELAAKPAAENQTKSLFDIPLGEVKGFEQTSFVDNEKAFRIQFTLSLGGEGERKLGQAINIFCGMQDKLEDMMYKSEHEELCLK